MPKAFFKSLLWALGFHGGLLGLILFTWPYWAHSIFPLDRYQIYRVSLVDPPKPIPLAQGKVPKPVPSGRPARTEKTVPVDPLPTPEVSSVINPVLEEKPRIPAEEKREKGEKGEPANSFSLQVMPQGSPSKGSGVGGQEIPSGIGKGSAFSPSGSKGTALASSMAIPRYGLNRRPYYPAMAREQGWQGTALLKVLVLKNGSVGSLALERSSGFSILDRSALSGVKDWKFNPGQKDGQPTEMWVQIPVTFRLE
jgi:protein TonB